MKNEKYLSELEKLRRFFQSQTDVNGSYTGNGEFGVEQDVDDL